MFPVLTPLDVDPGHPFPFMSNLSSSFGVLMRFPDRGRGALRAAQGAHRFSRLAASPSGGALDLPFSEPPAS